MVDKKGVSSDSPAEKDELKDDPAAPTGDSTEPEKRTAENVYRELTRKLDARDAVIEELREKLEQLTVAPAAPPVKKSDNPLDDIPIETLKASRSTLAPEQREAFDAYMIDRMVRERVDSALKNVQNTQVQDTKREQFKAEALRRYPDLEDKTSEFRRAVDREIRERGDRGPRAILDAANAVALEMGVRPQSARRIVSTPPSADGTSPAPRKKGDNEEPSMSKETAEKIAANLQGALPSGKKFDTDKIRKKRELYKARVNSHTRG